MDFDLKSLRRQLKVQRTKNPKYFFKNFTFLSLPANLSVGAKQIGQVREESTKISGSMFQVEIQLSRNIY